MKNFKLDNARYIILALNTDNDKGILERNGISVLKELLGSYNGVEEASYLVAHSELVLALAEAFGQECVLTLGELNNGTRQAYFETPVTSIYAGEFKGVGNTKPVGDWSYDIESGEYYTIFD